MRQAPAADDAVTIAVIKDTLGERVSDVRASQRLTRAPPAWSPAGGARTASWSGCSPSMTRARRQKPILEINLKHPLVAAISGSNDTAADLSFLLLEQA